VSHGGGKQGEEGVGSTELLIASSQFFSIFDFSQLFYFPKRSFGFGWWWVFRALFFLLLSLMGDDELVLNIVSEPAVEPYPNKRRRIKGRPAPPDSGAPSSVQSIQQRGLVTRGAKRGRTRGGGKTVGRAHIPSSRPPAASPSAVAVSPVPAAASVSPVPSAAPGTAPTGGAVAKASSERGQKKRIRMPRRERFLHYEFKESDVFSADSFEGMGLSGRLVAHMKGALLSGLGEPVFSLVAIITTTTTTRQVEA